MHIDYVSVGKRIRELRIKQGLTQNKLAEKSGIEPSNISHIERAATKLSLPTLVSIANFVIYSAIYCTIFWQNDCVHYGGKDT